MKCLFFGHTYTEIERVVLVDYPEKLVLVDGRPVVEGEYYGMISYLHEKDTSKEPKRVGMKVTLYCSKCGKKKVLID